MKICIETTIFPAVLFQDNFRKLPKWEFLHCRLLPNNPEASCALQSTVVPPAVLAPLENILKAAHDGFYRGKDGFIYRPDHMAIGFHFNRNEEDMIEDSQVAALRQVLLPHHSSVELALASANAIVFLGVDGQRAEYISVIRDLTCGYWRSSALTLARMMNDFEGHGDVKVDPLQRVTLVYSSKEGVKVHAR